MVVQAENALNPESNRGGTNEERLILNLTVVVRQESQLDLGPKNACTSEKRAQSGVQQWWCDRRALFIVRE